MQMNFNPTNKELEGKITVFSSLENQHFTINEVCRYYIWGEQTAFWLVKFIF